MHTKIHAQGIELKAAEQQKVKAQVEKALANFADRVSAVDIYIKDINGPRGGNDKSVVIHTRLIGRTVLASSALKSKLLAASAAAASKTRRRVKGALRRQRRFQRNTLRDTPPARLSATRSLLNA